MIKIVKPVTCQTFPTRQKAWSFNSNLMFMWVITIHALLYSSLLVFAVVLITKTDVLIATFGRSEPNPTFSYVGIDIISNLVFWSCLAKKL